MLSLCETLVYFWIEDLANEVDDRILFYCKRFQRGQEIEKLPSSTSLSLLLPLFATSQPACFTYLFLSTLEGIK